jgi:hypothetical protein
MTRLIAVFAFGVLTLGPASGADATADWTDRQEQVRASEWVARLGGSLKRTIVGPITRSTYPIRHVDLHGTAVTDGDLASLAALPALRDIEALDLRLTSIGDSGMVHVRAFKKLHFLNLFRTRVGDAGVGTLRPLAALDTLHHGGTRITDDGVRHLLPFRRLSRLSLFDTQVGDSGLLRLAPLKRLEVVLVDRSRVTEAGKAAFRRTHPGVRYSEQ